MIVSLGIGGFLRVDSQWILLALLIIVGAMTNGIFNPHQFDSDDRDDAGRASGFRLGGAPRYFGLGNALGVALSGLLMSVAFEQHTGSAGTALTAANPSGFVVALNVTFLAAAGWSLVGLATSLLGSGGKRSAVGA